MKMKKTTMAMKEAIKEAKKAEKEIKMIKVMKTTKRRKKVERKAERRAVMLINKSANNNEIKLEEIIVSMIVEG